MSGVLLQTRSAHSMRVGDGIMAVSTATNGCELRWPEDESRPSRQLCRLFCAPCQPNVGWLVEFQVILDQGFFFSDAVSERRIYDLLVHDASHAGKLAFKQSFYRCHSTS